jgi:hypothetical protein
MIKKASKAEDIMKGLVNELQEKFNKWKNIKDS